MFRNTKMKCSLVMLLIAASVFCFAVPSKNVAAAGDGVKTWYALVAGQNYNAGYVTVKHTGSNMEVEVITIDGWQMLQCQIAVAKDYSEIPQNKKGSPVPGKFAINKSYNPTSVYDNFQIDLSKLKPAPSGKVVIAVHAVVQRATDSTGCTFQQETAWGVNCVGSGLPPVDASGSNWATYIEYNLN